MTNFYCANPRPPVPCKPDSARGSIINSLLPPPQLILKNSIGFLNLGGWIGPLHLIFYYYITRDNNAK